ncbi:cardiolipin synthase [Shouchella lehensis]|uniref:Cardiolipin synthase n=1 Tax=Shouchella lehensis G1 TaxID=1246626 RepID=A0A060M881_9BACI|nr:cardiolipin synthase [Shouchella lehensis]AIC96299.1 Phospholipase D [Shouchella lehensis G1]
MLLLLIIITIGCAIFLWLRFDYQFGLTHLRKHESSELTSSYPSKVSLLSDGEALFACLLADIADAKDHVHIQFYIFRSDGIGKRMIQALCEKAEQGVSVRLLIDQFGCKLSNSDKKALKQAGVHFQTSSRIQMPWIFFSMNRRNHRKLGCIDGRIGYIGGFNVGDEYLGRNPFFGYWRDFHIRLTGTGVHAIQSQFMRDFEKVEAIPNPSRLLPSLEEGSQHIQFLSTQGVGLEKRYLDLIHSATQSIAIGTPYFIPTKALKKALVEACQRGVQVTILLPEKADHPFVKHAATPFIMTMIEEGALVHHYYRGFYHVKVLVVDRATCLIGTANFDQRSLHLNNEMSCFTNDELFIHDVETLFQRDLERSITITAEALKKRPLLDRLKEKATKPLINFL